MDLATLGIKVQTEGVAEAATSLDKLDKSGQGAAKTAEKLAPALDKTGTAAGKSSKGTGDAAASMAKLDKASDGAAKAAAKLTPAMQQTAMSAGALANATRQLPMQFTDIFTGLATGQKPMQVFLQQGGQLKDTFGGVGPALQASGSYIMGLVTPMNLAAAAAGALAITWKSNSDNQYEFAKALIVTGGYSGKTVEQLQQMTNQLDKLAGVSKGSASSSLLAVANSGKFAGEQFDMVARAAAQMESATGKSVEETVRAFEKIKKDPVAALLELHDRENFLTQAQLARIDALVDEGNQQQAVSEALKIAAQHYDEVSEKAREAMPAMSKAWAGIKDDIGSATGELSTFLNQIDKLIGLIPGLGDGFASEFAKIITPISGQARMFSYFAGLFNNGQARLWGLRKNSSLGGDFQDVTARVVEPMASGTAKKDAEDLAQWIQIADKAAQREAARNKIRAEGIRLKQSDEAINAVIARQEAEWAKQDQASAGRTRKKAKELTEEEKQTKALTSAYDSLSKSMDRRLFMLEHGSTEAAATQYALERGELSGLNDELARTLKYMDNLGNVRAFESVSDARERLLNTAKAADAEADFDAIYGGMDQITKKAKDATDSMSVFGEQAARNMQDSFADFLFDPFKDGVSGMVENFGKAIQRMLADAAAAKIFEAVGTWASSYQGKGAGWINAISGMITKKNANGGVYDSPSLSAYSGKVYDSPQYFAFAKGAGVFGEAGPEAIMPLKRGSNGRLGVAASGGGAQQINIEVENKGQPVQAQASAQRQPDGSTLIKMVLDSVADDMASGGKTAQAMQSRFNVSERV